MRVLKKQIFLTTFSLAALLVLLQLFQVSAKTESEGDKATKKFLDNVVQLSANFSIGEPENGFGFVVGERGDKLYVVTANHVVRKDEPDVRTTNIEATFHSDQGDPKKAKLLKLSAGEVDLALLEISKPFPGYLWETNYFSTPQQNNPVWFIGRDEEWWVPADIEAGIIKDIPIPPTFSVRIRSVKPGTSGAPLISKEGIIGMILKDDEDKAEALDIETIHKIVTLKWNYPWGLKQSGGKIPTPELTIPADVKDIESKAMKEYKNDKGFLERDYGDGIIMVYIPAGKFTMGSNDYNDEKPPHEVYLDGYWIGKYEVTFDQYDKYCDEIVKKRPDDQGWGRGRLPLINVSWDDADAYFKWLSAKKGIKFKLPTEAQWEKAARWTDRRKYPWGNSPPTGKKVNFADSQLLLKDKDYIGADKDVDDGYAYTAPVGSYPNGASPYGLLDMAGNVWEWCSDWYWPYNAVYQKNPAGPKSGDLLRVARGGGWGSDARDLRSSGRGGEGPSFRADALGFRLCQDN